MVFAIELFKLLIFYLDQRVSGLVWIMKVCTLDTVLGVSFSCPLLCSHIKSVSDLFKASDDSSVQFSNYISKKQSHIIQNKLLWLWYEDSNENNTKNMYHTKVENV